MTFALYELAMNPDVQEKLRQEIKEIIVKHEGQITYEAMMDMKYLQMIIDGKFESLIIEIFVNYNFFKKRFECIHPSII